MKPIPAPYPATSIEDHYAHAMRINDGNMGPHLPRLRVLADGLQLCVEFGVRRGGSSSALLLGAHQVISFDITATKEARQLQVLAGSKWNYLIADSLTVAPIGCDLLFIDSKHTYRQCDAELQRHADRVGRWLVFHDSIWRGSMGEGTNDMKLTRLPDRVAREAHLGIRPAIDQLMMRDPSWFVSASYTDACGLLVLERRRA